ncbi:MAG: ATP-binding cassette domain-containing protein, partial [Firmicutes bacterium]|nr:ATP-binding cassette domain-containing protein [Bacillota bacterium]
MATPVIEVKSLKKYFPTPRGLLHAVDDVTLTIQKGETLGVVGESGCGKSTLGRTIIHLHERTDGQIFLNGEDISDVKGRELRKAREKMQIIFQDPYSSLDPRKTVEYTIKEPLRVCRRYNSKQIDQMAEELMELVGIDNRLKLSYPHELDGGRRQRV